MNVLVGYASAHGSTAGIANQIAERLRAADLHVDVKPVEEIDAIEPHTVVVLGSAIHDMAWLPQATEFVQNHTAALAEQPVWLFSVSSVGDTSSFLAPWAAQLMRRMRKEPKGITAFRQAIHPRGHRNFAGVIERSHWDRAGDLFLRACGGRYGDHRDWHDIDNWADHIARQLTSARYSGE